MNDLVTVNAICTRVAGKDSVVQRGTFCIGCARRSGRLAVAPDHEGDHVAAWHVLNIPTDAISKDANHLIVVEKTCRKARHLPSADKLFGSILRKSSSGLENPGYG